MPGMGRREARWLTCVLVGSAFAAVRAMSEEVLLRTAELELRLSQLQEEEQAENKALDTKWLITCGTFVFFMQLGFTMLEAGSVRPKNRMNILLKNLLDSCVGAFAYYLFGFCFQYGGDGAFIDADTSCLALSDLEFGGGDLNITSTPLSFWWFQFVLASITTTIVSGAMAERTRVSAYVVYSFIVSGFIYPVVARWVWNDHGWLAVKNDDALLGGYIDFAGSGVVHLTGGMVALCGATIVGPRRGRFDEAGRPVITPGQSGALQVLGTITIWVGWYGFNAGATLSISTPEAAAQASRVVVTTSLSAAFGGFTVVLIEKLFGNKVWSITALCNGILVGLVSITGPADVIESYFAILVGIIAGCVYLAAARAVLVVFRIDDPVDAIAVHAAGGLWGNLAAALFASPDYAYRHAGLFYGDGRPLGAFVVGSLSIITWTVALASIVFSLLKVAGELRIGLQTELVGIDAIEEKKTHRQVRPRHGTTFESSKQLIAYLDRSQTDITA